jgi:hypothetical protein
MYGQFGNTPVDRNAFAVGRHVLPGHGGELDCFFDHRYGLAALGPPHGEDQASSGYDAVLGCGGGSCGDTGVLAVRLESTILTP